MRQLLGRGHVVSSYDLHGGADPPFLRLLAQALLQPPGVRLQCADDVGRMQRAHDAAGTIQFFREWQLRQFQQIDVLDEQCR